MSTHKFDDPEIQARFDEIKASRQQVIAQEAEDVFDKYLHQLAKRTTILWKIFILDKNLNEKSEDEINVIANLLQQKDKTVFVTIESSHAGMVWAFIKRVVKT